jgi:hypothetical protein
MHEPGRRKGMAYQHKCYKDEREQKQQESQTRQEKAAPRGKHAKVRKLDEY